MKNNAHHVNIRLQSTINDSREKEINTFQQSGRFYYRNNVDVLLYEEIDEDGARIKNFITIHPDKVNIKRSGFISMNQQFEVNRKTETYYKHPHGYLHLETYTESIDYHSLRENDKGKLMIDYTVKINGTMERKHLLELTYKEEDS